MIVIPYTTQQLKEARKLAKGIPKLKNSIRKGRGRLIGCIGEVAIRDYMRSQGSTADIMSDYDYDILLNGKKKVEVKSKSCNTPPKPDYEGSVSLHNDSQQTDVYAFTRIDEKKKICYIMGYLTRNRFFKLARLKKKGESDSNKVGGKDFKFHTDCWNIFYHQLREF